MITKKMSFPLMVLLLLTIACSKEKTVSEQDRQTTEQLTKDYLMVAQIFESSYKAVDSQAKQQGALNGFNSQDNELDERGNCPETSFSATQNTIFPATLELDFGSGCVNDDGITVAGKITAVFNGLLLSSGTSITLNYSNFVFDGHTVSGTYVVANQGEDANGQHTFTATVDGQVQRANGRSFTYQATTSSKQTEGNDTNFFTNGLAGIFDDVWSVTKDATLTTSDGLQATISTPSAVRHPLNCRWPVSGVFELEVNNPTVISTLNYGEGNCDGKALLTIGDYSVEVNL